ncbi:MAG: hypothetical protein IJE71_10520 [Clostridia bacterium]|nr:hypothetical protein [Clostridia bacterium]
MNDMILILNYSDEYSMQIARRLRAEQVYAKVLPGGTTAEEVRGMQPRGVILSGESDGCGGCFDAGILDLDIPVLAIGHAAHLLLSAMGGASAGEAIRDRKVAIQYEKSLLFTGVADGERYVGSAMTLMLPADVKVIASAGACTMAFESESRRQYGVQFELERNDLEGSAMLKNFARDICGCSAWWSVDAALSIAERALGNAAQSGSTAVCAVSGGVDSTVAALLAHRAFGEKMIAVFLDTGLMRAGEAESIRARFEALGIPLRCVDRSGEILDHLAHKRSTAEKQAVVSGVLHEEMLRQSAAISGDKLLVLGTNYDDFLETGSSAGQWTQSGMATAEPLMELLKEEIREIAVRLGLDEAFASRKPFPALGLGARILGEITAERLFALRTAEEIFHEEICEAGLERKLYKYFPILAEGESGSGMEMILLRAVTLSGSQLTPARLPYDLVERTVQRIMTACPQIARVFYDQTPTQLGRETFF